MKKNTSNNLKRKNYGRSTRAFFVIGTIILIATATYGYFQYTKLAEIKTAIALQKDVLVKLQSNENQIKSLYSSIKSSYDEEFTSLRETISVVLPADEEFTKLTRILDDFVIKNNNTTLNPIFMSNISFSRPRIDKENGYSILPFTLNLNTTRENFEKFLEFIENSGSLDNGVRLMEVDSISINFPSQTTSLFERSDQLETKIPTITVNLSLKAYFQLPAETLDKK